MLTNVTDDEIKFFLEQKMIDPEVEKALAEDCRAEERYRRARCRDLRPSVTGNEHLRRSAARPREPESPEGKRGRKALVERYVRELNEQEDRVQSLRHEISEMQQKRDAAQSTLNTMVEACRWR